MKVFFTLVFIFLLQWDGFSQQSLNVYYKKHFVNKRIEMYQGDMISFRLKGEIKTWSGKISAFSDSILYLSDGWEIPLHKIKCITLYNGNHLTDVFQKYFRRLAILFIFVDTANNIILERPEVINKKALVVAGSLIAASFFVKRLGVKKVMVKKSTIFKVFDNNFDNLNKVN